jgi:putative SOS response-associated peptidase YedK
VRKVNEGEITNELFGFLTTEPNDVVAPIHPKAMWLILTKLEESETWRAVPATQALKLQRPLPDGVIGRDMFDDESRNCVWSSSIMR